MLKLKTLFYVFMALLLSACGGTDNTEPPSPLRTFDAEANFKQLWSIEVGSDAEDYQGQLKPYIGSNTIYIADHSGRITALDKSEGKVLWQIKTGLNLLGGIGGGAGMLFVATREGELFAFWQKDGGQAWKSPLNSEMLAPPAVDSGVVVVRTTDGNLQALSLTNGEKLWSYRYKVPSLSLRGTASPVVFAGGVLSGTDNGRLAAVAASDGRLLWETSISVPSGRSELSRMVDIDIPVIVNKGIIYVATYQGRILAINMKGGQTIWARDISTFREMSIDDDNIYLADENSHVWAFNRLVGQTVWRQDKLHARPSSGTAVYRDAILVADFEGYLHAMDDADGRFIARTQVSKAGIEVVPQVDEDIIYTLSRDGRLTALTLQRLDIEQLQSANRTD